MDIFAHLIGGILGIGLGVVFVIPLLVLIIGSSLAGVAKMIESILG